MSNDKGVAVKFVNTVGELLVLASFDCVRKK